jgi:hypothetical protein
MSLVSSIAATGTRSTFGYIRNFEKGFVNRLQQLSVACRARIKFYLVSRLDASPLVIENTREFFRYTAAS